VVGTLTLVVATATCAFASYNHVRVYRRTAAYARQIAVLAAHDGLTGCLNHRSFHDRCEWR
jgi:PleD family two-component response regulator